MNKMGVASNKKIIELYNMMLKETLILQPSFQRKLVWNNAHKENFLETILSELPFPEVYFADGKIDLDKAISETLVVDGQQRLSTIYEYITNNQSLILRRIPRFDSLSPKEQTNFYDYIVVVRDLGRISEESIKNIFSRINSVQYALNAMEVKNALYEGEFISAAKEILESNLLNDFEIFADAEISRMKDLGFVTLVLATIETGGYFTGIKEVETNIKMYDEEYPNKAKRIDAVTHVLRYVKALNLPPDSIWLKKSSFFTLIVELVKYFIDKGKLSDKETLSKILISLETEILKNKTFVENEFGQFYKFIFQGTASRNGRIVRGDLLRKFLYE